ncbi:MAG: 5'-nucleotidase [Deltaproteobacteria bacterium]|nr:5'-nucleotidase [Deltaproteobacteria bacterium]
MTSRFTPIQTTPIAYTREVTVEHMRLDNAPPKGPCFNASFDTDALVTRPSIDGPVKNQSGLLLSANLARANSFAVRRKLLNPRTGNFEATPYPDRRGLVYPSVVSHRGQQGLLDFYRAMVKMHREKYFLGTPINLGYTSELLTAFRYLQNIDRLEQEHISFIGDPELALLAFEAGIAVVFIPHSTSLPEAQLMQFGGALKLVVDTGDDEISDIRDLKLSKLLCTLAKWRSVYPKGHNYGLQLGLTGQKNLAKVLKEGFAEALKDEIDFVLPNGKNLERSLMSLVGHDDAHTIFFFTEDFKKAGEAVTLGFSAGVMINESNKGHLEKMRDQKRALSQSSLALEVLNPDLKGKTKEIIVPPLHIVLDQTALFSEGHKGSIRPGLPLVYGALRIAQELKRAQIDTRPLRVSLIATAGMSGAAEIIMAMNRLDCPDELKNAICETLLYSPGQERAIIEHLLCGVAHDEIDLFVTGNPLLLTGAVLGDVPSVFVDDYAAAVSLDKMLTGGALQMIFDGDRVLIDKHNDQRTTDHGLETAALSELVHHDEPHMPGPYLPLYKKLAHLRALIAPGPNRLLQLGFDTARGITHSQRFLHTLNQTGLAMHMDTGHFSSGLTKLPWMEALPVKNDPFLTMLIDDTLANFEGARDIGLSALLAVVRGKLLNEFMRRHNIDFDALHRIGVVMEIGTQISGQRP